MIYPEPDHVTASPSGLTDTRLRGRWLGVARVVWIIFFLLMLAWFGSAIAPQVAAIQYPCSDAACLVTPPQADALRRLGISLDMFIGYYVGIPLLLVLASSVVALLIWRRTDDWRALLVGFFLIGYPTANFEISALGPHPQPMALFLSTEPLRIVVTTIYYGVFLVFPSGRFVPRWAWLLLVAWVAYIETFDIFSALQVPVPQWTGLGYPVLYLSALGIQIYRYRHISNPGERQQTKWVVVGFAMALLANILYWIVLPNTVFSTSHTPGSLYDLVGYPLYELVTIALPISFVIAIQRHQLFDIDVLIRRTLVYGALTVILAALYFGVVLGGQALLRTLTGQQQQQPVVIVASTLLVAALFTPLRRGLQAFIDRRFFRRKYDAAKALAAFSATLRSETDLAALDTHLLAVVRETMQPETVFLWLAPLNPKAQRHLDASSTLDPPPWLD